MPLVAEQACFNPRPTSSAGRRAVVPGRDIAWT